MQEQEENQRLLKSNFEVPKKININGSMRIPCHHYPACNTVFVKALDYHIHRVYHDELEKAVPTKLNFHHGFSCIEELGSK